MKDNRKFTGSMSVRIDTRRVKLELSPAPLHGGPEGMYRVRVDRRWLDAEDGKTRFMDRIEIANLAARIALCDLETPAPARTFLILPACLCASGKTICRTLKAPGPIRRLSAPMTDAGWST